MGVSIRGRAMDQHSLAHLGPHTVINVIKAFGEVSFPVGQGGSHSESQGHSDYLSLVGHTPTLGLRQRADDEEAATTRGLNDHIMHSEGRRYQ